ncbi:hypothetical protein CALCODRAFT_482474 [Calocera cornea HHB12733]|uniref:EKC/KEOPS complex subunit GON7 n=1 Tax=Calocera cornea HHB12733 TaxID=1353952 RepID=A0A165GRH8_9BASI|nr:hypothetical protein CALCODRAFT_482474 [Calocera cornea HHB12733]
MTNAVVIDIKLDLPTGTIPPTQADQSLPAATSYTYPIASSSSSSSSSTAKPSNAEYYGAVRAAVAAAKEDMGAKLTAWRDAVGEGEKEKETRVVGVKKGKKVDEDMDDDEENEDDDE